MNQISVMSEGEKEKKRRLNRYFIKIYGVGVKQNNVLLRMLSKKGGGVELLSIISGRMT